ncbi:MAG TPA: hypothetical protein VN654_28270 [Vicinamibacterales bacterium]|jgi:hypothetical protein|nr:hypothetical protein [Vicinamibacterales bacterium]
MTPNFVHMHLLLNHVPTVGTIVALGVLLLGFVKRSEELTRGALALFFAIALVSLPTYMTGYAAQKALKERPGVSAELIQRHQSAALVALIVMEATGVVAWFGLWQGRKPAPRVSRWNGPIVLLLASVTLGLMASAANIGGEITHPEIMAPGEGPATAIAPRSFMTPNIGHFQFTHPFAWPMLESLHFIGLCLLFGVVLVGNMRILGFMKNAPFVDVHRLLPWGVWGFVINSVTGMMFFTGAAGQYIENPAFHLKVLCMLLAGANVLYLTLFDEVWALGPGDNAPTSAKLVAASQVFLWVGVIYFGRMLPYIGNAF